MALLILNAGSSTLKFSVLDPSDGRVVTQGVVDTETPASLAPAVRRIVADARPVEHRDSAAWAIDGVVHRVVHGGTRFTEAVRVTPDVRTALNGLSDLAPLHNPPSLAVIDAAFDALPDVSHVAVFDTAFHTTLSAEAFTYPLPTALNERWGLRRFGFHGLSHAYGAERAATMLGRSSEGLRVIVAHLGNGASVTAIKDGRSVDTSMGFTPLEGLMMGTRSGSVDPGLLLHLQLRCGISAETLDQLLNHESGLVGVSGVSSDMRKVLAARRAGDPRATLAAAVFVHRARQAIGAMAVTLGGVDALVFTGGIGEHSDEIRAGICEGLSCLGLELDQPVNASAQPDAVLSTHASRGRILVVTAREDLMMARAAARLL
jgi:acetate kinase